MSLMQKCSAKVFAKICNDVTYSSTDGTGLASFATPASVIIIFKLMPLDPGVVELILMANGSSYLGQQIGLL